MKTKVIGSLSVKNRCIKALLFYTRIDNLVVWFFKNVRKLDFDPLHRQLCSYEEGKFILFVKSRKKVMKQSKM